MSNEESLETVTITLERYKAMERRIEKYQSAFKVTGKLGKQHVVIDSDRVKEIHSHMLRSIDKVILTRDINDES